jgi:hypothetical protein
MTNIYYRQIIFSVCFVLLMLTLADAACTDVRDHEFIHREVSAANMPISGANCTVTMNNTQTYINTTDVNGWVTFCVNSTSFMTNMSCKKPSHYNAVLTNMTCPEAVYLDGRVSLHVNIFNTLGEPLEAQDCYVKVFNERGYLTEDLGTNLLYNNQTFLDGNGNYVRLAGVPISSSIGTFDYGWIAHSSRDGVPLYRTDQHYTVHAECNGKVTNCTFLVMSREPVHVDDDVTYVLNNLPILTLGAIVIVLGWFLVVMPFIRSLKGD